MKTELESVAWPPAPIKTERLVLREPEARDRTATMELLASPEVGAYIGGPQPQDQLERALPEVPGTPPKPAPPRSTGSRRPVPASP
ncbi:hypothetical protein [Kribbella shirazensis]|jgi:RimJ/RimL family protein N-acetyltransferase|uniref:RimJ/RimL family protein N-acetyltransferase n=1 Tax=Kribbella shirazensis TaxID=1105143 RepID=A0A7X5V8N4_9ACTN|nr:hypothetical protein [Kribbella shirazensis]NIK56002.1 RimJ/RimL family protein N-acetyltransferase [Kribbella shirazensis]